MSSKRGARIHQVQVEADLQELERDFSRVVAKESEEDFEAFFDVKIMVQGRPFLAHKVG